MLNKKANNVLSSILKYANRKTGKNTENLLMNVFNSTWPTLQLSLRVLSQRIKSLLIISGRFSRIQFFKRRKLHSKPGNLVTRTRIMFRISSLPYDITLPSSTKYSPFLPLSFFLHSTNAERQLASLSSKISGQEEKTNHRNRQC